VYRKGTTGSSEQDIEVISPQGSNKSIGEDVPVCNHPPSPPCFAVVPGNKISGRIARGILICTSKLSVQ